MNLRDGVVLHYKSKAAMLGISLIFSFIFISPASSADVSSDHDMPKIEMYIYGGPCTMTDGFSKQPDAYRTIYSEIETKNANVFGLSLIGNLHPHFGLEMAFEWSTNKHNVYLTDATYDNDIVSENIGEGGLVVKANGIVYLLKGRIAPYIKGGGGWYAELGDDFSPLLNYGGGIRIILYKNIAMRAEYIMTRVNYKYHIDQVEYGELVGGGEGLGEIPFNYSEHLKFKSVTIGIGYCW
jgi:hypothetical protein